MADSQSPKPLSNYEKVVERARSQTPEVLHALRSEMFGAYAAFVGATLLVAVTNAAAIGGGRLVITLLAVALPALVAQLLLDRTVAVIQRRKASGYRGLARGVGFLSSIAAFTLVDWARPARGGDSVRAWMRVLVLRCRRGERGWSGKRRYANLTR